MKIRVRIKAGWFNCNESYVETGDTTIQDSFNAQVSTLNDHAICGGEK